MFRISIVFLAGVIASAQIASGNTPQADSVGIVYLSPTPGSSRISPGAPLIVRFASPAPQSITNLESFVSVDGSLSGNVAGRTRIAADGRTVIFQPSRPFRYGETVRARIRPQSADLGAELDSTFSFEILSAQDVIPALSRPADPAPQLQVRDAGAVSKHADTGDPLVINGISIPSDFPLMEVIESDDPGPGYFFLNNWGGQPYELIVDSTGAPVWYWRTPDRRRDVKVQPDGRLTMFVRGNSGPEDDMFIALDSTFTVVDTMRAAAGYFTDEHELTVLPDGSYYLIGHQETVVDLSRLVSGALSNATVSETALQGFTPEGELVFLWRSWDHYDIRDVQIDDLRSSYIRFPHMNAVSVDDDGNILLSCRHLSEVTKINPLTGEIIWRLSGAHNQFTFVNDSFEGLSGQHDIRALGGGHYTVFDNGNLHSPPETRAVEYLLDPDGMTATVVWEYRHVPRRFTSWMGNAQRLPNGNTLINYADVSLPKIVEVRSDGSKALEMDFANPANSYRVFKSDWRGIAKTPYMIIESSSARLTLLVNKFGDPNVDHFNIYGGTQPDPTVVMASTGDSFIHFTDLENHRIYYFRATAVDSQGEESPFSNQVSAYTNLIEPGENMVRNGDFSRGQRDWDFGVYETAQASVSTATAGRMHIHISDGGTERWHVQLVQTGLALINGRRYRFEFDALASSPRIFEAKVEKDGEPWINYGRIGLTSLGSEEDHYTYDFTMDDPSDFQSRIVFNAGASAEDVIIDNVSLKELLPGTAAETTGIPSQRIVRLLGNHPNPFARSTSIRYEVSAASRINIQVFNLLGQTVQTLFEGVKSPGLHEAGFSAANLSPGLYEYRLEAANGQGTTARTGVMVVIGSY